MMKLAIAAALLVALPYPLAAEPAPAGAQASPAAGDACAGFKWDVSREKALFATAGLPLAAASDGDKAPAVRPDHLYRLQLAPAARISFPVAPGKMPSEDTYGGILQLTLPSPGHYRIAVDAPLWIDVVGAGRLVQPTDFEGQRSCNAPRKIVEFDLEGARGWLLQLSSAGQAGVGLVIVGVPAAGAAAGASAPR